MSEIDSLKARIEGLQATLRDTQAATPAAWKLTATEERIFRVLLAVDTATRLAISEGAAVAENRTIDVHVAHIRSKIAPFGAEIETVRARGWRLVGRDAWKRALSAQSAA